QLLETLRFGDGDLRIEQVRRLDLTVEQRHEPRAGAASMDDLDVVVWEHLAECGEGGEVAAGALAHGNWHVTQIDQAGDGRAGLGEDGEATDGIEVGHEPAHAGGGVAGGAPLARGV